MIKNHVLLIFREGGREERNIYQLPPTCDLGICPNQGSNPQPFGVLDGAPTDWATQPGQGVAILILGIYRMEIKIYIH